MNKDLIVLIDELKEKVIKLENENARLRKLTLTRGFHIKREVSKDIIQEIRKVKPPVTNSAATFAFELEKTLENIEKKYNV